MKKTRIKMIANVITMAIFSLIAENTPAWGSEGFGNINEGRDWEMAKKLASLQPMQTLCLTSEAMDYFGFSEKIRNMLGTLRVDGVKHVKQISKDQSDPKNMALVCLFMAIYPERALGFRIWGAKTLVELGSEYKDAAAHAYFSIAINQTLGVGDRLDALEALASFGENYTSQLAAGYLSIATAEQGIPSGYKFEATRRLSLLGTKYCEHTALAYFSIATSLDYHMSAEDRIEALQALAQFGAKYKDKAAEILLSIAKDNTLRDPEDRLCAAQALTPLGGKYKVMELEAYLSIVTSQDLSRDHQKKSGNAIAWIIESLISFPKDDKNAAANLLLSLAVNFPMESCHRFFGANTLVKLGKNDYKHEIIQAFTSIADNANSFNIEAKEILRALYPEDFNIKPKNIHTLTTGSDKENKRCKFGENQIGS